MKAALKGIHQFSDEGGENGDVPQDIMMHHNLPPCSLQLQYINMLTALVDEMLHVKVMMLHRLGQNALLNG
jgi:hypothetical protein